MKTEQNLSPKFTLYQKFVIFILAFIQFTVVLDFMIMSPLGPILMPKLNMNSSQFGFIVSAYAFSAGLSGFLTALFADKFDRKKLLILFYTGFILGTAFCALSTTFYFMLFARIFTGIFGGVISSISFAIITDLFPFEKRGRVMSFTQMSFAASQVLGLPISLKMANMFDWHASFWLIVYVGIVVGVAMIWYLKPVNEHLRLNKEVNAIVHLISALKNKNYLRAFAGTVLLATGGFMIMPFSAAFATNNLGISKNMLPTLYLITGLFALGIGPLIGNLSDKLGKFRMFIFGSVLTIPIIIYFTQLTDATFPFVVLLNVLLFIGINARVIPAAALTSAVPEMKDRGTFMSLNSSIQQFSGGVAAVIGGLIVKGKGAEPLQNFDILGWLVAITVVITLLLMRWVDLYIKKKLKE